MSIQNSIVKAVIDLVAKNSAKKLRLQVKATIEADIRMIGLIGCPGVTLTLANKGERVAKIKGMRVEVRGEGFIERFQEGFSGKLDVNQSDKPEHKEQIYAVHCLPIDKPTNEHGWVLEQDDICRFVLPTSPPIATPIATYLADSITATVQMFDDESHVVLQGEQIQPLVQHGLDYSIEKKLRCRVELKFDVVVVSSKLPSFPGVGVYNDKPVIAPLGEPWASDPIDEMEG